MTRPKAAKPNKPWKGFPLFAHASGTWAKKIGGKHQHFGPWGDAAGAVRKFNEFMASARLDVKPISRPASGSKLETVVDAYLTHQHDRARNGIISHRTYKDAQSVVMNFGSVVGMDRPAESLAPSDFAAYAQSISALGSHAFNRHIAIIRGMLKWAYQSELMTAPARYGQSFSIRSKSAKRREEREANLEHGKREFTPTDVRKLIDNASPSMKAMILLGINCGFGNTDIARLTWDDIDMAKAIYDAPRNKTMIDRRAPLWPETVAALRAWQTIAPKAKDATHAKLVFVTTFGVPFVREKIDVTDDVIQNITLIDSINLMFGKLTKRLGMKRKGRNFYALRGTFRTIAAEVGKEIAADRIMGHAIEGQKAAYIRSVRDEELRAVTDHVRAAIFRDSKARTKRITR